MIAALLLPLLFVPGFDTYVYLPGTDLRPPFDSATVYRIDTRDMSTDIFWHGKLFVYKPQYTPKTGYLAFSGQNSDDKDVLYVINRTGKSVGSLDHAGIRFSWMPDGTRLVYCAMAGTSGFPNGEIWIAEVPSCRTEKLPVLGTDVYWSPYKNTLLYWTPDGIFAFDLVLKESSPTKWPSVMRCFSTTEQFGMTDHEPGFEVCRLADLSTEPTVIATIRGKISYVPDWLNGHLLGTMKIKDNGVRRPYWYVLDCEALVLYESKETVVAADESDCVLVVKDGKIASKKLTELTRVSLDSLSIEVAGQPQNKQPYPTSDAQTSMQPGTK